MMYSFCNLVLPLCFMFPHLPLIVPDVKHNFMVNPNKLFLPLLIPGSSCDSCSIKWLWQQRQQHKQLTCIINSIQAATQKVKGKEAHQPLQNPETSFFFYPFSPQEFDSEGIFCCCFFRLKSRKIKIKSLFYITGGKMNF